jgi:chaperone modulatory protein CbpM
MSRSKDLVGQLLDEQADISLAELCRVCGLRTEEVFELIELGIVEPRARNESGWRFASVSLRKARIAVSLRRDLDVNFAGAALALDLLDELTDLRARLRGITDANRRRIL